MRLNQSTDHAIRIMLLLAKRDTRLPSIELSQQEQLSRRYMFRITSRLRDAGLLTVFKGPDGGYQLAKAPADITLHDIILAVEGPLQLPDHAIVKTTGNTLGEVYLFFKGLTYRYLQSITLETLAHFSDGEIKQLTMDFLADEKARLFLTYGS